MNPYLVALVTLLCAIGAATLFLGLLYVLDTALTRWSVSRKARPHSGVVRAPAVEPVARDLAEYRRSRVIPIGRAS